MKNKKIRNAIIIAGIGSVILGTSVFAASDISSIESKFYDFKKAVIEKQVQDGKITQENADEYLQELEQKLSDSEEDVLVNRFGFGHRNKIMMPKQMLHMKDNPVQVYADMIGSTTQEIVDECKENDKSLFELAEEAGKLDELKTKMLENFKETLDNMIEEEKITQEQADTRLDEYKQRLESGDFKMRPMDKESKMSKQQMRPNMQKPENDIGQRGRFQKNMNLTEAL